MGEISPDGRWVVMARNNSNADSDLFLTDLSAADPAPVNITVHEGDISHGSYAFSADSTRLIYATNEFGEFNQAWAYDLASGEREVLIAADWDVSYVNYSPSGRYRVSGTNVDASTVVSIVDTTTGEALKLASLPLGDIGQVRFSRDEKTIAFGLNSDTAPYDLYVCLLYTSPSPRDVEESRMPSSA